MTLTFNVIVVGVVVVSVVGDGIVIEETWTSSRSYRVE